jgi:hypothetical protein
MKKTEVRIVFEFCSFHYELARDVLSTWDQKKIQKCVREYVEKGWVPKELDKQIQKLEAAKLDDIGKAVEVNEEELKKKKEMEEQKILQAKKHNEGTSLISMPDFLLFDILSCLEPYSLARLKLVSTYFVKKVQNEALYKSVCKALFRKHPRLPVESPFVSIVNTINNSRPGEYTPEIHFLANKNFRDVVWLPEVAAFRTDAVFYNQFKDWYSLYLYGPKVRLDGIYSLKEKYLRTGMRSGTMTHDPLILVEFHRYLRFLSDGSVIGTRSIKKLSLERLKKILSVKVESDSEGEDELMYFNQKKEEEAEATKGEYILKGDTVYVKLPARTLIYEIEAQVISSSPNMNDGLLVKNQQLKEIGGLTGIQSLTNQQKYMKIFKFKKIREFIGDVDNDMRRFYP